MPESKQLRLRTKQFAVRILKLCRSIPETAALRRPISQLSAAGTAVGANYRSACRARSHADFVSKLGIVAEEADETTYWLEVFVEAEVVPAAIVAWHLKEADELTRIFIASHKTAQSRQSRLKGSAIGIRNSIDP